MIGARGTDFGPRLPSRRSPPPPETGSAPLPRRRGRRRPGRLRSPNVRQRHSHNHAALRCVPHARASGRRAPCRPAPASQRNIQMRAGDALAFSGGRGERAGARASAASRQATPASGKGAVGWTGGGRRRLGGALGARSHGSTRARLGRFLGNRPSGRGSWPSLRQVARATCLLPASLRAPPWVTGAPGRWDRVRLRRRWPAGGTEARGAALRVSGRAGTPRSASVPTPELGAEASGRLGVCRTSAALPGKRLFRAGFRVCFLSPGAARCHPPSCHLGEVFPSRKHEAPASPKRLLLR